MKSETVIVVLVACLVACILAAPVTEGFLQAENALVGRYGNAGYGEFDQRHKGGWLVNGYRGLPVNIHHQS